MASELGTMVWVVTFRTDNKAPQQELTRYTEEAASHFAQGIIDMGGVAVVTEDFIPAAQQEEDEENFNNDRSGLKWD